MEVVHRSWDILVARNPPHLVAPRWDRPGRFLAKYGRYYWPSFMLVDVIQHSQMDTHEIHVTLSHTLDITSGIKERSARALWLEMSKLIQ